MTKKELLDRRPIIVDRCWSLLPLSLISALIVTLFFKSSALFYVAFMEEFNISHQSAIWPLNMTSMMQHLAGLLVNLLQDRLTLYHIMLLGCALNAASLVASAFVPNIVWMTITAGVINGLGTGMGVLSLSLYAMTYFDKYRATASGYKYAGGGLVPLVFPLAISAALREYGLRGTLLLLAAVTLHLIPIAMLMKSPKPTSLSCKRNAKKTPEKSDGSSYAAGTESAKNILRPQAPPVFPCSNNIVSFVRVEDVRKIPTEDQRTTVSMSGNKIRSPVSSRNFFASGCSGADIQEGIRGERASVSSVRQFANKGSCSTERMSENTKSSQKEQQKSTQYEGNLDVRNRKRQHTSTITSTSCQVETSYRNLFKNPAFYLLVITFTVAEYTQQTFETTVFDYAMDKGIERSKAEPYITYVAAAQILGQLTLPFLWDSVGLQRSILAALCLLAEAVCFMAMPHATKFWHVLATTMALSFPMGCLLLLKPVLLSDHLGVRRLAACWGIAGIAMVPFGFGVPPLIGVFRDTMGSYDNLYRTLAALCAVLAVAMLFFAFSEIRAQRRLTKSDHVGFRFDSPSGMVYTGQ